MLFSIQRRMDYDESHVLRVPCSFSFQRRRFDYDELVGIAGDESRVLVVDSILDLDTPEFLGELMELICGGNLFIDWGLIIVVLDS